jgi:SAM-dependent methyltransferase
MANLSIIGASDSHDTLLKVMNNHSPCRILDVPAGRGGFAQHLHNKGWDVQCADIDTGLFAADGIPIEQVNLNKSLPYEDSCFDAVSCINGIHRVLYPDRTIAELGRVLRPGGHLYLNVNNYSSIVKRLRFLCSGSLEEKITLPACEQTIKDPEAHIRNPLMFPRIALMLRDANFEIVDVKPAAVRARHRLLAPLAWLLKLLTALLPPGVRRRLRSDTGNASGVFPGGLYMLVVARKAEAPATS